MKKFWLFSIIGLTASYGQASANISISSADGVRTLNMNYVAPQTQVANEDELNEAINRLTANAQRAELDAYNATEEYYASLPETEETLHEKVVPVINVGSKTAPSIAAQIASRSAHGRSIGRCALYVRKALQSAGYRFTPQASAYMYANGTLAGAGFIKINSQNYKPQVGDVVVFNRTSKNPHGHIQIYDGRGWVSDFRQNKFSPYSQHNGFTVWRDSRYLDASNTNGTYLAWND